MLTDKLITLLCIKSINYTKKIAIFLIQQYLSLDSYLASDNLLYFHLRPFFSPFYVLKYIYLHTANFMKKVPGVYTHSMTIYLSLQCTGSCGNLFQKIPGIFFYEIQIHTLYTKIYLCICQSILITSIYLSFYLIYLKLSIYLSI